ncbi:MAG: hypothetical protein IJO74_07270 [Clostridia bacterium]|nr:hypothetical protein [Clostridia bacterium]
MNDRNCGDTRTACSADNIGDVCCIDTYKIFDSCRDQLCLEDLKVLLTDGGQEILNASSEIRIKNVKVAWVKINTEEMPFNRGYYQIKIRYYFYIVLEGCVNGTPREFSGIASYDQTSVLCGGECNVSTFRSDVNSVFCGGPIFNSGCSAGHHPQIVLDVADPIVLNLKVKEKCPCNFGYCVGAGEELPEQVSCCFDSNIVEHNDSKAVFVSIGIFALIRLQRATQIIVPAGDYCVPDKQCSGGATFDDACSLFRAMSFPVEEFFPKEDCGNCGCGCTSGTGKTIDPKEYR